MDPMYLEIVLNQSDLATASTGRDELEELLEAALNSSKLGALTGGGSSTKTAIIEIELFDATRLEEGLALLRKTLVENRAPESTRIKQLEPEPHTYGIM